MDDIYFNIYFALGFFGFYLGFQFLMSRLGWARFARKYPAKRRPPGVSFVAQVVVNTEEFSLKRANYPWFVRAIPCEAGLYLYILLPLRLWHRPFLVPWSSVTHMAAGRPFFRQYFGLEIKDSAGTIGISLPAKAESVVLSYHPGPVEQIASLLI